MKKIAYLLLVLFFVASCDEIDKVFNPSSDYLLEKDVKPTTQEQIFESSKDFKMIFPANSLSGNLEVKVKKESSVPELNIQNLNKGKNFYKIKFNGDGNILKPIQIIINYDKSAIPTGKTASESVFGYIYSSSNWKLADYELDEQNSKIIISLSSTNGKVSKDEPILLDDGEIIIGDAYTTTDTGQSDNPLSRYNFFSFVLVSNITFDDGEINEDEQWEYEYTLSSPAIKWNGNEFSFTRKLIEPKDWITEYETEPDSTIEIGKGIVSKDGKKLIKFTFEYYHVSRTYYSSSDKPDLKVILKSFTISDLDIYLPDLNLYPNGFPFEEVSGSEIKKYVTDLKAHYYYYHWNSFDKKDEVSEKKSVSFNWNGTYSMLNIYFRKLENVK